MSPKERVLTALDHREPDRVPVFNTITPELAEALAERLGITRYTLADSPLSQNRISFHELLTRCGNDVVGVGACAPNKSPTRDIGNHAYTDEWHITYKKVGCYTEQVEYPLAEATTVEEIRAFPFPDPDAPGRFDLAERDIAEYGENYAVCGDLECTIFEGSWHMIGMEKYLLDLTMEENYIFELMDQIQSYSIGVGKKLAGMGVDFIWLGDDMGTQRGMLISPDMWRKYFKKRLQTVISEIRSVHPEVKFAYHSCGSCYPIMADLIEIGVDILNALQPNAQGMDLSTIKSEFGSKVSLFGGLDVQNIIPFGSIEDVEEEIRRVIRTAAPGGGLLLAGAHNYQPDVSVEKLLRIYEITQTEGCYPITI
ncbi:MAG: uroporphyrinogen decarboxylase family protein [Spirochaetaceae bacterium]|nr:uroporphyrinogen decarboxylase family protein [Spirochaetaceae bacterium]